MLAILSLILPVPKAGYEQADIDHYGSRNTPRIGQLVKASEPNRTNFYDRNRTDPRAQAFEGGYVERMNMHGGCG